MATTALAHVLKVMEEKECMCYTVYDGSNTSVGSMLDDQQDAGVSVSDAIDSLRECVGRFEDGGIVTIRISPITRKDTGEGGSIKGKGFTFKVRTGSGQSSSAGNNSMNGLSAPLMTLMEKNFDLQSKMIELNHSFQLENLKRDFEEFKSKKKKKDEDGIGGLNAITPYIPALMQKMFPDIAPVHAISDNVSDDSPGEETAAGMKKRFTAAIVRWRKADPKYIEHMELIASAAEKNIKKFNSYMPIIKASLEDE